MEDFVQGGERSQVFDRTGHVQNSGPRVPGVEYTDQKHWTAEELSRTGFIYGGISTLMFYAFYTYIQILLYRL